jgi:hypothetical protein
MESLNLERTESTPHIVLNPKDNYFEISGESRPENVSKFYEPILIWLEKYNEVLRAQKAKGNSPIQFNFKLEYFNSSSIKFIYDILKKLEDWKENVSVQIAWFYDDGDEDMLENGQEFTRIVNLPFNLILNE